MNANKPDSFPINLHKYLSLNKDFLCNTEMRADDIFRAVFLPTLQRIMSWEEVEDNL